MVLGPINRLLLFLNTGKFQVDVYNLMLNTNGK